MSVIMTPVAHALHLCELTSIGRRPFPDLSTDDLPEPRKRAKAKPSPLPSDNDGREDGRNGNGDGNGNSGGKGSGNDGGRGGSSGDKSGHSNDHSSSPACRRERPSGAARSSGRRRGHSAEEDQTGGQEPLDADAHDVASVDSDTTMATESIWDQLLASDSQSTRHCLGISGSRENKGPANTSWRERQVDFRPTKRAPIATGATSSVYAGELCNQGGKCLVKIIEQPLGHTDLMITRPEDAPALWELFDREVAVLDDPVVKSTGRAPTLLGFLAPDQLIPSETPKIVMNDCGMDLIDWQEKQKSLRPQDSPDVLDDELTYAVEEAVQAFNATGWVHGDLSWSNMLVTATKDGKPWFTLIDFGSSRRSTRSLDHSNELAEAYLIVGRVFKTVFRPG